MSRPPRGTRAAVGWGLRSDHGATCAPWSTPSGTPPPVPAAEIWPRRRACRGPSDRRQETTSSDPSASDETPFPPSPIPADGRCRTRRPVAAPSAAKPPARYSSHTQNRRASEARPSAQCTAPRSRTAPQTPEARPSDPLLDRPGYATSRREVVAGELAALVGVEDLRPTKASERFLERFDAKIGAERVRQL